MEAFCSYTLIDPEAPEHRSAVIMAFVNQAAPNIRRKLQKIDRLADRSIQELLEVAERVYNNRESPEDKQIRILAETNERHNKRMAKFSWRQLKTFLRTKKDDHAT